MKKIAYVTDTIWPYMKGGKEKRLFDITTRLTKEKNKYNIHIYTMKWWNENKNVIVKNGVTLHAISPLYPLYNGKVRSIKEGLLFGLACLKLINEDWDIIDVDHMPFFPLYAAKLVCLLKNKKMIATWHEVWGLNYWVKYMGPLGYISYLIEKFSIYLPNKIISISEHTTKKIKKELFKNANVGTVSIGVDLKEIQNIKSSTNTSDIIYTGRLLSHKNIDILLKAVSLLKKTNKNIKLFVIGDGPEKANLEKITGELKLTENIKFFGFVENHDEVYELIKSSKVFVLPSEREGFGIVTIEAFACGIPVVTVDSPDNASKDLIKNGVNGYVTKLNGKDIAEAILKSLQNNKLNLNYNIKQYDWKNILIEIKKAYSK